MKRTIKKLTKRQRKVRSTRRTRTKAELFAISQKANAKLLHQLQVATKAFAKQVEEQAQLKATEPTVNGNPLEPVITITDEPVVEEPTP